MSKLTIGAEIRDDNTVWIYSQIDDHPRYDLGVYGPYDSRLIANEAAQQAVGHAAARVRAVKNELLAERIAP